MTAVYPITASVSLKLDATVLILCGATERPDNTKVISGLDEFVPVDICLSSVERGDFVVIIG